MRFGEHIAEVVNEIERGQQVHLIEYGLELATTREYIRQTQQRLIVAPLLARMRIVYPERGEVERPSFHHLQAIGR